MALNYTRLTGPVVIILVVVLLVINLVGLIGVDLRLAVPRCNAIVVLEQIEVRRDTDPDSVYPRSTDSWNGTITFILDNQFGLVPVAFEGDTGHIKVLNLEVIRGDVGKKGETVDFIFDAHLFERDGPPYGGPLPRDIGISLYPPGSLQCPGNYPLRFPVLFAAVNRGEAETDGYLVFSFTIELDP